MIKTVTVGGEERVALVLPKNWDDTDLENVSRAIKNALLAVSMDEESKDALSSTSMYFLLYFLDVLDAKEGGDSDEQD